MVDNKITPEALWARQGIGPDDVDYGVWNRKRKSLMAFSAASQSCIFTVDVFKRRYDFASDNFSTFFGYNPAWIKTIQKQGDLLEERIHPDDRAQLIDYQIEHGNFIYSLPAGERNNYRQIFQYRILSSKGQYINVVSRQQVMECDRNHKAWMILGVMEISPDQTSFESVHRTVVNRFTGQIAFPAPISPAMPLTPREIEVLRLVGRGLLSKEISDRLNISIFTVNNHRKNILTKLRVNNAIEAINRAGEYGIF